jgi:predicted small metal-binding protein
MLVYASLCERRAGIWQRQMRNDYKKGNLSAIRIDLLNQIKGWVCEKEHPFEDNLDIWKNQFMMLGKYPCTISGNIDEKRARRWQDHIRTYYKKGKLSQIRLDLLNNIKGWTWSKK